METVSVLSHGGLVLDPEKQKVTLHGQRIELTHHEFTLLHALMAAPGRVFSRDELLAYLYPNRESIVIDRVVDVHIGKIRQKLEKDPTNPCIHPDGQGIRLPVCGRRRRGASQGRVTLRKSLLWKLLGVNLLVIVFVISVVWLAINYLAAGYFMILMEKYHISPTASHQMFIGAVHRYLIWASAAAFVLALALSSVLMRRLLRPLTKMTGTAQRIAEGDYTGEVPVVSDDEVGRLSEAFNRMSASLRHTEQLRKRMVIDVAHELRTPLTNIKGYLEALADDVLVPTRETFQLLQEETVRLTSLVEDIMRLARADAARADLHKVEIEAHRALAQMVDGFRRQFEARRMTVKVELRRIATSGCRPTRRSSPRS